MTMPYILMLWFLLGSLSMVQASPSLLHRNPFRQVAARIQHSKYASSQRGLAVIHWRGGDSTDMETEVNELGDSLDGAGYDEEYDESEEEFDDDDSTHNNTDSADIDEPYFLPPSMQLYTTFACMLLSRRIDFFDPTVVRVVRFAFLAFIIIQVSPAVASIAMIVAATQLSTLIIQQLFVFFVRLSARRKNDLTVLQLSNPLPDLIASQMKVEGNTQALLKKLTSSFLSSDSTVMEYDLKQASDMQGAVLLNICFMWFLHFRLEKVQPLVIQIMTGFMQLIYSPLFQVYVLGKNLQRPFKTPTAALLADSETPK